MIKKGGLIFLILILLTSFLISGTSNRALENSAYVVALGIDAGDNNLIKLTFQFASPSGNSKSGSNSSSSQSDSSSITTIECSSIDSGISLMNSYMTKKVNLSHCKAIVISQTLAYSGVSEYISTLMNHPEVRPLCNVIISKCDASDFLNNSKPMLETVSARYYELILTSSQYVGYSENVLLSDFYSNILDTSQEAIAILGGINSDGTHLTNVNLPPYDIDSSYTASESPIKNETSLENLGLAVFTGDKLIGELTGMDTICHLIITNNLNMATISIPSPFSNSSTISLYISLNKKTKNSISFLNGFPYIASKIYVSANILSLDDNIDYTKSNNLKLIEDNLNTYLTSKIYDYLYATSKVYKSDISGFGKLARRHYLTTQDWESSFWLSNYQNTFFSVEVSSTINSSYLFNKT